MLKSHSLNTRALNSFSAAAVSVGLTLGFALFSLPAQAEKADRDKPVNLEADRVTVDDVKKEQVFEGNVQLVKGTLVIHASRLVVTQDDTGFQHGIAYGSNGVLPRFRQKREGMEEIIEGEAERIEHDAKTEKTEFHNKAWVRSGTDEVRGEFISYDAKTEHYYATSGANGALGTAAKGQKPPRVTATIQPKGSAAALPPSSSLQTTKNPLPATKLQGANELETTRTESQQ